MDPDFLNIAFCFLLVVSLGVFLFFFYFGFQMCDSVNRSDQRGTYDYSKWSC